MSYDPGILDDSIFSNPPGFGPMDWDPPDVSITQEQIGQQLDRFFQWTDTEDKAADLSGAPMLAHLEGQELEGLLTLLQGIEDKEAAQARKSLAQELASRKGGPGSGHQGHAGVPGVQGGSLPGTGTSWAHHGGDRDPIRHIQTGSYMRGRLARGKKDHDRRREAYYARVEELTGTFSDLFDQSVAYTNQIGATKDPKEKARLKALEDQVSAKMNQYADDMDANSAEWWAHNASYKEKTREMLYVNNPATQIELDTGRLRKVENVREGHAAFARMVPAYTAGEAATVEVKRPSYYGKERAYYQDGAIHMPVHTSAGVAVHELGHFLEEHNPRIHTRAVNFLEKRTRGEKAVKLSIADPTRRGYKDYEVTKKDKFAEPYTGKQYSGGRATEVISMGLEGMYRDPAKFAAEDPEYFDFMWDTLRERE